MNDDPPLTEPTLDIYQLHASHALNRELLDVFATTAAICLQRHHTSPQTWSVQLDSDDVAAYQVSWNEPSAADHRSYNNDDETTEFGACGIALAAADVHLGLVAYARAEPRTGIDFYLVTPRGTVPETLLYDFDHTELIGLEVSGIDRDTPGTRNQRLRDKVEQARRGDSPDRALAGVVGFQTARVVFRTVKP
jgi:hypothetical protein